MAWLDVLKQEIKKPKKVLHIATIKKGISSSVIHYCSADTLQISLTLGQVLTAEMRTVHQNNKFNIRTTN